MADLDVKAMDWARREADRLVFTTHTIREMRDAIETALLSVHEAGRAAGAEQMREAAAAVLDDMACGSAATLDMALFRSGAQAIRALPLPASAPSGWRPISEAPKDGTWFLATDGREIFKTQGAYGHVWIPNPNGNGGHIPDPQRKSFSWLASEFDSLTPWSPTHFMPLPAPPKEAA